MTASANACLGVEKSLTGKRWVLKSYNDRDALTMAQREGVSEPVARLLSARGIPFDAVRSFMQPSLKDQLPDPSHLKDMDKAAERLASAVMGGEQVAVFGDYDVDGATSSSLLQRFLVAVGGRVRIYIPDRLTEGYGPNAAALTKLRNEGASVVVTVDCGTGAVDVLGEATEAGLDIIVADHHEAEAQLPKVLAVVNPKRLDQESDHGHMAAVGVVFLLIVAVNRALRAQGWYDDRPEPNLMNFLDLVALGTVCDVVPLIGVNRAFVAQGLKVMAQRRNIGLKTLGDVAGIDSQPTAYHAGFLLGPRINAGGRVGQSNLGARLLTTDDEIEAREIAERLNAMNKERQEIEAAVVDAAIDQVEQAGTGDNPLVMAIGEGWHPGVIGIVASRLKERYNRPSAVVALDGGQGTGSARSVTGVDLGAAVLAARQSGLLLKGGGHAMAAGFTVAADQIDALRDFFCERLSAAVQERGEIPNLYLDGTLPVSAANKILATELEKLGPFGTSHPEPRFAIENARVTHASVVGAGHVRCSFAGAEGGRLDGIAFRALDSDLGKALLEAGSAPLNIAGRLRLDTWQGRANAKLYVDDAAPVWVK